MKKGAFSTPLTPRLATFFLNLSLHVILSPLLKLVLILNVRQAATQSVELVVGAATALHAPLLELFNVGLHPALISSVFIPDGVELPGKRVLRLVPKLALLLQLRLLLHQEEVEGSLLLAFASCLLHFRTSSHVSRPLRRRADKRFVRHALCLPYDWDLLRSVIMLFK